MRVHAHVAAHTHTHNSYTWSHTITAREAPFFRSRREWWLSLSPQSKIGHSAPISSPIKFPDSFIVLVFHNFLSSVIQSASGSCCTVRMGLGEWQELAWKVTAGWKYSLIYLAKTVEQYLCTYFPLINYLTNAGLTLPNELVATNNILQNRCFFQLGESPHRMHISNWFIDLFFTLPSPES